jgi:leucyl-tRNA synthetase
MEKGKISGQAVAGVFRDLTLMLAPFAPFLAAEIWEHIGGQGAIFRQPWPTANPELARETEVEIPVQVNGKLVTVMALKAGFMDDAVVEIAMMHEKVKARIEGKSIVRKIVIPGKLVNIVVK